MSESFKNPNDQVLHVEGQADPNATPQPPKEKLAELTAYEREARILLDSHRRFFQTFAKDVSLTFKVGNAFFIDLEKGEVNVDARWFAEKGFTPEQILWAHLHELSHFRDLAEDTEGMKENFAYIKAQARKTGTRIFEKKRAAAGGSLTPEQETAQRAASEQAAHKIHHTFYNILDDIFVNSQVARRAPTYAAGSDGNAVIEKLYREKLFADVDYRKLPRHLQFMYALLRRQMVPDEQVQVTDDVRAALDMPLTFKSEKLPPAHIVERFLKPRKARDTKAAQRYAAIRYTLEPVFEQLLAKDLEEWEPQQPQEQKGGEGAGAGVKGEPQPSGQSSNPFDAEYREFERNSPDQISDADIAGWLDKTEKEQADKAAAEKEQREKEKETPEEKAARSQAALDAQWGEKHDVPAETLRQFRRVEGEVEPYLDDLSRLWRRIIGEGRSQLARETVGHFTAGTELDIAEVIKQWPEITKGKAGETRVMKRQVSKEVLMRKPEEIRVRLVGDLSGSMDAPKKAVLERCFVLLLRSLQEFQSQLNLERTRIKTKLTVDTEAWVFGNKEVCIKQLRGEGLSEHDEQAEIIRIFEHLNKNLGATYDDKPLSAIANERTADDTKRIEEGKLIDVVFEITDGGSSDAGATVAALNNLEIAGIIARAFQIGKTDASEKETFNTVWNRGGRRRGEIVGEKIENLLPALTEALKEQLRGIRL